MSIQHKAEIMLSSLLLSAMFSVPHTIHAKVIHNSVRTSRNLRETLLNHKVRSKSLDRLINKQFKICVPANRSDYGSPDSDSDTSDNTNNPNANMHPLYQPTYEFTNRASHALDVSPTFFDYANGDNTFKQNPVRVQYSDPSGLNSDEVHCANLKTYVHKKTLTFYVKAKETPNNNQPNLQEAHTLKNNSTGGIDSVSYRLKSARLTHRAGKFLGHHWHYQYTLVPYKYRKHDHKLVYIKKSDQDNYPLTLTCRASAFYTPIHHNHKHEHSYSSDNWMPKFKTYTPGKAHKHKVHKTHAVHHPHERHAGSLPK